MFFPTVVYEEFKKIQKAFLLAGYGCKLVRVRKLNVDSSAMVIFNTDVPVLSVYSYNILIKDSLGRVVQIIILVALTGTSETYAYYASSEIADCRQKVLSIYSLNRWTSMITVLRKTRSGSEYRYKKPLLLTNSYDKIAEEVGVYF